MKPKPSTEDICLRPIPYPYKAMLAICSDLDKTPDLETYLEIVRFLNTTRITRMGKGLGLECGNSIYFDMPKNQFSYWNTNEKGRDLIRTLIQSGHIDCLHSYGDLADSRRHAEAALDELTRCNCQLSVWVDHSQAPTNFGPDIMRGQGDVLGSKAYHADLTISYGIKYVWLGRVTSVFGQEVPRSLAGIWAPRHPIASFKTVLKEFAKGWFARFGNRKYSMHLPNKIMRKTELRDRQQVLEFIRSTFHWGGISYDDTANGLKEVFTKQNLDLLVVRRGVSIIYTHLGKLPKGEGFSQETIAALRLLKKYYQEHKILVTTTYRLLNFIDVINSIRWNVSQEGTLLTIYIFTERDVEDLQGLSFWVPHYFSVNFKINGKVLNRSPFLGANEGKACCIFFPWQKPDFPIA